MNITKVKVHPISEKLIRQGHPWILKDQFTQRWPTDQRFLKFENIRNKQQYYLIQDQTHPKVKGRVWGKELNNFKLELKTRISNAIEKRRKNNVKRENIYWVFAEADQLPGLKIQSFGNRFFIQYFTEFWISYENIIIEILLKELNPISIYRQLRFQKRAKWKLIDGEQITTFEFIEFDCHYKIDISDPDLGFYTDMAAIREQLKKKLSLPSILNLFSYTGAYSLYSLKLGANSVTSVDLSSPYMQRLESNLRLNTFKGTHHSVIGDVEKYLDQCIKNKTTFDTIICDPPSCSTDGSKKSSALQKYDSFLQKMDQISTENIIIFLNTHQLKRDKFKREIQDIIARRQLKLAVTNEFNLHKDCPRLKGFPEGDYLKGLLLQKLK